MNSLLTLINSPFLLCFVLGILVGMLVWDLAFEARSFSDPRQIDIVRSYYKGLHTASRWILLVLPIALILMLTYLIRKIITDNTMEVWIALLFASMALVLEFFVAVPKEIRLWKMKPAASANNNSHIKMRLMLMRIRHVHITVLALFLSTGVLAL